MPGHVIVAGHGHVCEQAANGRAAERSQPARRQVAAYVCRL